jgi:carbonic anhydrase/acetyltransferase-like protein (isoleucine patch superfamily)
LGPGVLVHPRAMLVSVHGPLIINDGTVITEKCIIGGPVPDAKDTTPYSEMDIDPIKTVIGSNVLVLPHSEIHAGAMLYDACIVESHALVTKAGSIGRHGKVCPGAMVTDSVGDWEVVFGCINQRRRRIPIVEVEEARLKAMQKDREATIMVLRASSRTPVLRKK